jgi:hypothetical protein
MSQSPLPLPLVLKKEVEAEAMNKVWQNLSSRHSLRKIFLGLKDVKPY